MRRELEESFSVAVGELGPPMLRNLHALEHAFRRLHPPNLASLRDALEPLEPELARALGAFRASDAPEGLQDFADRLEQAAATTHAALGAFLASGDPLRGVEPVLHAMRDHAEAQGQLYPLRQALPPIGRFFLEPAVWDRADGFDPEPPSAARVGLHHAHHGPHERGGFSFYVPEWHDGQSPLALVVALHGGRGHGRNFLWSWLREARSRGFALLSPTSRGPTWSLMGADLDAEPLESMVAYVGERWPIDDQRVLLTGLSDGATYTLLCGLREGSPFTALAPVSGVLHPHNFANGNLERAARRRIHLVHGALDWMFPIDIARAAAEELTRAGADLVFREIADLSHTYPRDENDTILRWFDPGLALPDPEA